MRHQFDRGVILGIVLLAAMMVAIAVISYLNTRALRADSATATQSRTVITTVVTIQADTRRLQAAQRAYIISGLEDRLQPYEEATADIRNGIARLKELTAGDPSQLERAEAVGREFESGIVRLNEVVALRREKGLEEILKLARNAGAARSYADPMLDALDQIAREERERLSARDRKTDEAYFQTVGYGFVSSALGLVALGLLVWLLVRSARARAKSADRLAEQRQVLNATLNSIGDAVIATDTAGRVTFLNPVAEKLTGWPTGEAAGRPLGEVFRIVNESTRRPVDNPALRALANGSVVGLANHTILIARDGSEYPIDDSAAPIRDAAGRVSGAVLVFRDITERKRAEAAQVQLAAIVEASDDAIVSKTLDGTIRTWNRGAERLFGYSAGEAVGRPITLIIPPERRDEERTILDRVRSGTPVSHFETVRVTKDGRPIEISLTVSPVRGEDGRIVGASKIARDVGERKRAEAALRAAEERAEFVRRASGVGFWFCDLPFDVLNWDEQVKAHFWLPSDAPVTIDTFYARIHPDDRDPTRRAIDQSISGHTGYDVHYRTVNPDTGEEKWVRAIGRTFYAADGTPERFDGVTLDVTVEKRAEAAVRAAEGRFRQFADTAPAMLWVTEPDGRCSFLSRGWYEFTGQTVEQGLGFGWLSAVHPDDRADAGRQFADANHRQVEFSLEHRLRRADGVYRWVIDAGRPRVNAAGEFFGYVGSVLDITDRKEVEDAVVAADRQLRLVTENVPALIAYVGADRRYRFVNRQYETWFGRPSDELEGRHLWEVVGQAAYDHLRPLVDRALAGEQFESETFAPYPGGGRHVHLSFVPRLDGGRVVGYYSLISDVTERKRAEMALRESEERYRALVTATADVVYRMSPDWAELYPLDGRGLVASTTRPIRDWMELNLPAAEHPRVRAEIDRAVAAKAVFEIEHQVKRPDGTLGWTYSRAVPILDPTGRIVEWFGTARDVTEAKRIDLELTRVTAASERRKRLYETVLSATPDFVYVFSLDHRVLYANDALIKMWGHPLEDTIGKTFLEIGYEPWHAEMHDREIDQVRATKAAIRGEVPFTGTNGRRVYDYIFVPVFGATGEVEAVAGTTRDVTDRKGMEQELRDADRRKDEFLATLAHELRNPLAPVRTGVHLLRVGRTDDEAFERTVGMMDRQLKQLVHLVDDLMDMSRVSRGLVVLRPERVELRAVVDAAVETSRQAIETAGHELAVRLPDDSLVLDADPTRLTQVIANLLNNAAKYTPAGGRITLSADRDGSTAVLRVTDTGVGIPADMLTSVFDMFTQVGSSLARSQGGLGIGLTLVRRLVEMHGGTVTAESPGPDAGSTFIVRLPLVAAVTEPAPAAPTRAMKVGGRLRVLVVDDNRDAADSLAMLLELVGGHEVRTAYCGADALAVLDGFRPHLILLDLGMPGMTGYEVARRVRERSELAGVRLAALTGWGQEDDRRRTKEAGFDHHLVKPVDPAEVERILADVGKGDRGER